jgi:hypothetical protein
MAKLNINASKVHTLRHAHASPAEGITRAHRNFDKIRMCQGRPMVSDVLLIKSVDKPPHKERTALNSLVRLNDCD